MDIENTALQLYLETDVTAIEMALDLVEEFHYDKVLHEWILSSHRGKWVSEHTMFFLAFEEDKFVGYAAVMEDTDNKHWVHFGSTTRKHALRNIYTGLSILQRYLKRNGITELYAESEDPTMDRLILKVSLEEWSILKHGKSENAKNKTYSKVCSKG